MESHRALCLVTVANDLSGIPQLLARTPHVHRLSLEVERPSLRPPTLPPPPPGEHLACHATR